MLNYLLPTPLTVELRGRPRRFRSATSFASALDGSVQPSPALTAAYLDLDEAALRRELDRLTVARASVAEARAAAGKRPDRLRDTIRDLDPPQVPTDQGWRTLLTDLGRHGRRYSGYHAAALERYEDYLSAAQSLLRTVHGRRLAGDDSAASPAESGPGGPRQRLIFDLGELDPVGDPRGSFERATKGQPLDFKFRPHQSLTLKLARYDFTLVSGDPFLMVDDRGHDVRLPFGRTVVGRGGGRDAAVDPSYRAVSREHLVLDIQRNGEVTLTDISSLGTWVEGGEAVG